MLSPGGRQHALAEVARRVGHGARPAALRGGQEALVCITAYRY